jgi:hypothetical protein
MLRNSLKNDPPEKSIATWANAFDANKLGVDWIKHLMDITRKGMGIQMPQQQKPVIAERLLNALICPKETLEETKRMSAAVKLQRAWDRERAKSDASRERMRRELELIAGKKPQEEPAKKDEAMLPKSSFAGSDKNKLGPAAHLKGNMKRPAKAGDLVGASEAANPAQQAAIAIAKKKKAGVEENFADGKNPGRKGLAKRSGVDTKASVSDLRKTAKHSTGEKARMAHWLANMKAGKAKHNDESVDEEKQRLDPHCWKGYRKAGTKMKGGKRVNNCVPVSEDIENLMAGFIKLLENKK